MNDNNEAPKGRIRLGVGRPPAASPPSANARVAPDVTLAPFPDSRVLLWTPADAKGTQRPDVALVVSQEVMVMAHRAVSETLEQEVGGFLLGNKYQCPNSNRRYVIIDQYSPARFTEATSVSLAFTKDAWARLADELTGKFRGKTLVGWYHSHPRMGIFLSRYDVEIHDERFPDDFMSALVIDPEKDVGGFFARRSGRLDDRVAVEFYEYLEGEAVETRTSVMPWRNHLPAEAAPSIAPVADDAATALPGALPIEPTPTADSGEKAAPFPTERLIHWVPAAGPQSGKGAATLMSQDVLQSVNREVMASLTHEVGGFLLGNRYRCPNSGRQYIIIDQYSAARFTESTNVSLSFTAEAWARLDDELTGKFSGKLLLGWYHSHPGIGIFLSPADVQIHEQRFHDAWQVALVVDPQTGKAGLFGWSDGRLDPNQAIDFHEYADLRDRKLGSLMPWSGYQSADRSVPAIVMPKEPPPYAKRVPAAAAARRTFSPIQMGAAAAAVVVLVIAGVVLYRVMKPAARVETVDAARKNAEVPVEAAAPNASVTPPLAQASSVPVAAQPAPPAPVATPAPGAQVGKVQIIADLKSRDLRLRFNLLNPTGRADHPRRRRCVQGKH